MENSILKIFGSMDVKITPDVEIKNLPWLDLGSKIDILLINLMTGIIIAVAAVLLITNDSPPESKIHIEEICFETYSVDSQ